MPLLINLRHLEKKTVELQGELPINDLALDRVDELIKLPEPLEYDLQVERLEQSLLVQGSLRLRLDCECSRCLKPFTTYVDFPEWACHLPLQGEEKVEVTGDFVDLTGPIREDILLALPQHPLCEEGCKGLPKNAAAKLKKMSGAGKFDKGSSAWAELDKLNL